MSKSPSVVFKFENNNVQQTTPLLGVSCFLARTEKGPYDDPSELITSFSQFQRIFGKEIVPDGSVSNIEKALVGGSKLRIIRVLGAGAKKGTITKAEDSRVLEEDEIELASAIPGEVQASEVMKFTSGGTNVSFGLVTKGYGDPIGSGETFKVGFSKSVNTIFYNIYDANGSILESGPVITYKTKDAQNKTSVDKTSVDYLALSNFASNSAYLEPKMVTTTDKIKSFENLVAWLQTSIDQTKNPLTIQVGGKEATTTETMFNGTLGTAGADPTADEWIASLDLVKDYTDVYQLACSHIHQHLKADRDVLKVHKAAKDMCAELQEYTYYIEVPKYTTHYSDGTQPRNKQSIITWIEDCLGSIGNSKYAAYFAGGIKYYNEFGLLTNSDVLGTIFGLGDTSASNYGPWKSFAGMNRGVIYDGQGPVSPNYGSDSRYNELNELAQMYANMIVIKDTPSSGKQTMLWHCFSSQVKQDSERFLSIVRLNLYLKKTLRPILNKYLEEPNIWGTWKNIYLEVKPILDNLVDENAMSEYTWMGDQDAGSYSELSVNNEADVRQGKYKVILKYKDIVPMQEITINIVIDAASKSVNISENE
jgi:hypothetical protein